MAELRHVVKYQGFPCRAVKYRRSDGLSPEQGYVDISIKDLAKLSIEMPQVLWRNKDGLELPGQLGIDQLHRLYSGELKGQQTVTSADDKKKTGFNLVGVLSFETFSQNASLGTTSYSDVYVAFDGIEEITEKLASARKHSEGFVRVPITDVRQFYTDYGLVFQDINCRLESGVYDPKTVKEGGTPWSLVEVLQFLLSQLPGTPKMHPASEPFKMGANPPSEIIGEGEPAAGILQSVLNQYGLVAKFLPNGDYLIAKVWGENVKPGHISTSPGHGGKWPYLKTEKKTVQGTNRPPLVCVRGRRRVSKMTVPYFPVIQWTDGRYYHLRNIGSLIPGYSLTALNKQVLNNEGKNFQDVLRLAPSGAIGYEWMQRLRKWAYKGYAPVNAFRAEDPAPGKPSVASGGGAAGGAGSTQAGRILVVDDESLSYLPFLPVMDAPWYKSDLNNKGVEFLFKGASSKKDSKGDFDDVILLPPIVYSRSIGEMWFADGGEITAHIKKVANSYGKEKEYFENRVQYCQDRATGLIDHINATNRNARNVARMKGISSSPFPIIEIDEETRTLASEFGRFDPDVSKVVDDFGLGVPVKFALTQIKQELQGWKDRLKESDTLLKKALNDVGAYQSVYASYRGFMGIGNLPPKVAEQGKYSLDRKNGILLFGEPQCVGQSTLVMGDEWQTVVADGGVTATFGYEYRWNGIYDWTTIYVSPQPAGKGKAAKAVLSGYSRPSGIKAKLERMPDVTMYLDEFGMPMNLNYCTDAAMRKAQFQVSIPDGVEGYQSIYHGFPVCVLDSGINGIQYEWEGGKSVPLTHVFQNYPGGRGPLGPSMVPTLSAAQGRANLRSDLRGIEER